MRDTTELHPWNITDDYLRSTSLSQELLLSWISLRYSLIPYSPLISHPHTIFTGPHAITTPKRVDTAPWPLWPEWPHWPQFFTGFERTSSRLWRDVVALFAAIIVIALQRGLFFASFPLGRVFYHVLTNLANLIRFRAFPDGLRLFEIFPNHSHRHNSVFRPPTPHTEPWGSGDTETSQDCTLTTQHTRRATGSRAHRPLHVGAVSMTI